MKADRTTVLSIAGFDPSAGAGVLADVKTFEQHQVMGLAVQTCWSAQNEQHFEQVGWLKTAEIISQLKVLLQLYKPQYIKVGLVPSWAALRDILQVINSQAPSARIILDPVLSASAGFEFHQEGHRIFKTEILPQLFLITPNAEEYKQLFGSQPVEKWPYAAHLLLKGGHREHHLGEDLLVEGEGISVIKSNRGKLPSKHGTGCILSAAITAQLALGQDLKTACHLAKEYLEQRMAYHEGLLTYHHL